MASSIWAHNPESKHCHVQRYISEANYLSWDIDLNVVMPKNKTKFYFSITLKLKIY